MQIIRRHQRASRGSVDTARTATIRAGQRADGSSTGRGPFQAQRMLSLCNHAHASYKRPEATSAAADPDWFQLHPLHIRGINPLIIMALFSCGEIMTSWQKSPPAPALGRLARAASTELSTVRVDNWT
jgi:hypothetical protein